jgi:hypothetical protein
VPDGKVGEVTESPEHDRRASDRSPLRPGDGDTVHPDPDDDAIDEVGEESFPASDSPSSWSGPPSPSR